MPVDLSIYDRIVQPDVGNALAAYGQVKQVQNANQQNKLLQMQLQTAKRDFDSQNVLRDAYAAASDPATGQVDSGKLYSTLAAGGAGNLIPTAAQQQLQLQNARLDQMTKAATFKKTLAQGVAANPTQDMALGALDQFERLTGINQDQERQSVLALGNDPAKLKQWGLVHAADADKLFPKTDKIDTGGTIQPVLIDPVTGIPANAGAAITKTASPDAKLSSQTQKEVAGIISGGKPIGQGSPYDSIIDDIGQGKIPIETALARAPMAVRQQIMSGVSQKYPDYDYTTVAAKKKAAADFTSGTQGNAMRSFATSGQHLDQLNTLIDALGNGDNQTVNKVANAMSAWSGGTAPTNFDAAKDIVSKEVVKAIVAGGGGVSEREELANLMSKAKSPEQLKGVISQYRNLMQAQYDNLLEQRRAAGLPDSTLPNYKSDHGSSGAAKTPMANAKGWTLHVDAKGNKAYVSPDGKQYEEVK